MVCAELAAFDGPVEVELAGFAADTAEMSELERHEAQGAVFPLTVDGLAGDLLAGAMEVVADAADVGAAVDDLERCAVSFEPGTVHGGSHLSPRPSWRRRRPAYEAGPGTW